MLHARLGGALFALILAGCGARGSEDAASAGSELGAEYSATVTTNPATPTVGANVGIDIVVRNRSGAVVTSFDLVHTQPMHLIAVSSDLSDFIHIHPTLSPAGHFSTNVTFGLDHPYSLFMEYEPTGTPDETLSRAGLSPAGATFVPAHLRASDAFMGDASKTVVASNTSVRLEGHAGGMLMANTPAHVVVDLRDANGAPISDLTNWLGMPAHAIVLSEDLKTFVHLHGMPENGGESTSSGPLGIDLTLPTGGLYKMFLQFQRGTTVITAPFVLDVMASQAPPPTCAGMTCPTGQHCMMMGNPPAPMCM
jgi:hypothetical protein